MVAAAKDDRAIVVALLVARADVDTKNSGGCAFPATRSARVGGGRWCADAAVPAPSGRYTALHHAATDGAISTAAELLVGGADQRITNIYG
jgi:hypothetical protein